MIYQDITEYNPSKGLEYTVCFRSTPSSLFQAMADATLAMMLAPFGLSAAPETKARDIWLEASTFMARRAGLVPGFNFTAEPKGTSEISYRFSTVHECTAFMRHHSRLHHKRPEAANADTLDGHPATIFELASAAFPHPQPWQSAPQHPVACEQIFPVKGLRAANWRNPKAPVIPIHPTLFKNHPHKRH